jgi:hypothetical protein
VPPVQALENISDPASSAGEMRRAPDADLRAGLARLIADRDYWGEPPSYGEMFADPQVQRRVVKVIAGSARNRLRRAW